MRSSSSNTKTVHYHNQWPTLLSNPSLTNSPSRKDSRRTLPNLRSKSGQRLGSLLASSKPRRLLPLSKSRRPLPTSRPRQQLPLSRLLFQVPILTIFLCHKSIVTCCKQVSSNSTSSNSSTSNSSSSNSSSSNSTSSSRQMSKISTSK